MIKFTLPNRTLIAVSGEDAKGFLQGLITNDINKADDTLTYAFFLSPQGRFLADLFIIKQDERYLLDIPHGSKDDIIKKFKTYRLRSRVVIEDLSETMFVEVVDSKQEGSHADPRHELLPFRSFVKTQEPNPAAFQDLEVIRIKLLIPDAELDFINNRSFPLEFGGENLNAIDYKKGCYIGQEVTARTHYSGTIRKNLFIVTSLAPLAERMTDIVIEGMKIGIMLGSINCEKLNIGLALLNIETLALTPSREVISGGNTILINEKVQG